MRADQFNKEAKAEEPVNIKLIIQGNITPQK
jgi:hypothetical protein